MTGARPTPWAVFLVLLLTACAAPGPRESTPDAERERLHAARGESLHGIETWSLSARLGVDTGEDGGSGRLEWQVDAQGSELQFRGTLGRGAWRLTWSARGAVLSLADGTVRSAASVEELVLRETGADLPVEGLHWWVRGMASPGSPYQIELDEDGLATELIQDDWHVRYTDYTWQDGFDLPRRLVAVNGERRVKLVVSRWRVDSDGSGA